MNSHRRAPADLPTTSDYQSVIAGVLLLVMLCLAPGWAQAIELCWDLPETREMGSPFDPADVAEFRFYCDYGRTFDAHDREGSFVRSFPADARSGFVPFEPGTEHTCSMSIVDTDGRESGQSPPVTFTEPVPEEDEEPASPPKPPVLSVGACDG